MHEIPNLPFPSLHDTEQTTTLQAGGKQTPSNPSLKKKPLNAARPTAKTD